MNSGSVQDQLLAGQRAYYSALARDYLDQGLDLPGGAELTDALDAFGPAGSVLELACGPGTWTRQLLRHASDVTAVEASPEMLAIAASRLPGGAPVRFVQADLFTREPDRGYDVVFMGFWLSHVPAERFGSFWALVAAALAPHGRVFFADDCYRTPDELIEGPASSTVQRRIPDGTAYRIVKVPYEPADLERQLRSLGWGHHGHADGRPVFRGAGNRAGALCQADRRLAGSRGYASRPRCAPGPADLPPDRIPPGQAQGDADGAVLCDLSLSHGGTDGGCGWLRRRVHVAARRPAG